MGTILQALGMIVKAIKDTNPMLTAAFAMFGFLSTAFTFVNELWSEVIARFLALVLPDAVAMSGIQFMGFMNYFMPITETCAFLTAWSGLYLGCTAIRMVKGCIPTVAT